MQEIQNSFSVQKLPFLRELDSMERFHRLMCLNHSNHVAMGATISGATSQEAWRYALKELQQRHAFLNVFIDRDANSKLAYRWSEECEIPLIVKTRKSSLQWQEEFEHELSKPLDPSSAPLLRALLLQDSDGCDIILVAHHTIADGMSLVFMMRDLIQALSGEKLEALPVPPSQEQRHVAFAAPTLSNNLSNEASPVPVGEETRKPVSYYRPREGEEPKVHGLQLSTEQTSLLVERARQEKTTVHAALCAALVSAGQQISASWRADGVRVLSPISIRKALNIGEDSVVAVTVGLVQFNPAIQMDFWELARWSKQSLLPAQAFESIGLPKSLQEVLECDDDEQALAHLMKLPLGYDLVVTNVQRVPYESKFGPLTMEALWGPSTLNGIAGEQAVSVATVNGTLCLAHTSYTPLDSFLETGVQILMAACGRKQS